jgi:hypothetical protein
LANGFGKPGISNPVQIGLVASLMAAAIQPTNCV